jgi:hypothetical protein
MKCKLFFSYCSCSFFGSELLSLDNDRLNDICASWCKSIRRIWNLPNTTHCFLLPLLCYCLPIYEELCRRTLNFIYGCISHEPPLIIRSVAAYATKYARNSSCLGRNLLWCCQRYNCSLDDIFHGYGNDFAHRFCNAQILESHLQASEFLHELTLIRDGSFPFTQQSDTGRD